MMPTGSMLEISWKLIVLLAASASTGAQDLQEGGQSLTCTLWPSGELQCGEVRFIVASSVPELCEARCGAAVVEPEGKQQDAEPASSSPGDLAQAFQRKLDKLQVARLLQDAGRLASAEEPLRQYCVSAKQRHEGELQTIEKVKEERLSSEPVLAAANATLQQWEAAETRNSSALQRSRRVLERRSLELTQLRAASRQGADLWRRTYDAMLIVQADVRRQTEVVARARLRSDQLAERLHTLNASFHANLTVIAARWLGLEASATSEAEGDWRSSLSSAAKSALLSGASSVDALLSKYASSDVRKEEALAEILQLTEQSRSAMRKLQEAESELENVEGDLARIRATVSKASVAKRSGERSVSRATGEVARAQEVEGRAEEALRRAQHGRLTSRDQLEESQHLVSVFDLRLQSSEVAAAQLQAMLSTCQKELGDPGLASQSA